MSGIPGLHRVSLRMIILRRAVIFLFALGLTYHNALKAIPHLAGRIIPLR
jgi:hypothetical protein